MIFMPEAILTHQYNGRSEVHKKVANEDNGETSADIPASPPAMLSPQALRQHISILLELLHGQDKDHTPVVTMTTHPINKY